MSDILLAEIIRLVSIVLSMSIVNFVVGYRKNCDIDKWKNIAIQSVMVHDYVSACQNTLM